MAILTAYDNNGNKISIPAIRGETGPQGEQGIQGKSAYEIAVENGYTGTAAEWLASLVGPKGDTGEQGPTMTLGEISLENTTTPPSGAAVAAALADAAPNLTPENYIEIVEETTNAGTENEETLNKIRSTIGNAARRQEHAYDNIVIETYAATNTTVHTIPVIAAPSDYKQDKIRIIGDNFDTGLQPFSIYEDGETCAIPFASPVEINSNYGFPMTQFQITKTNSTFEIPYTIYLQTTENDDIKAYPLTLDTDTWVIPEIAQNNQQLQSIVPVVNDGGEELWTDIILVYGGYNVANPSVAKDLCMIATAKADDNTLDISSYTGALQKENPDDIAFYCCLYAIPAYKRGICVFSVFSEDVSSYYAKNIKIEANNYYLPFNTTTTYADAQITDAALTIPDNTKPAFIAEFLDDTSMQLICSESLKYQNLQVILDKVGTIQWPGDTVRVGPHLEVRNNKIDFPYGQELIKFKKIDEFNYVDDSPYYSSYSSGTEFEYNPYSNYATVPNLTITDGAQVVISAKATGLGYITQTSRWMKSTDEKWMFAYINCKESSYSNSTSGYLSVEPDNKLLLSAGIKYDVENNYIKQAEVKIPGDYSSNTTVKVTIEFGEWEYGIKKIPAEMLETQEIETTTTISEDSTAIPTAGAVYTAIENGGKVKTVNNQQPDSNGNINITIPTIPTIRSSNLGSYSSESNTTVSPQGVVDYVSLFASGAMHFRGTTTTALSEGATTSSIRINGSYITVAAGDVVLNDGKEYVYDGSNWHVLGDESSWVPITRTVNNKALSNNITLNWSDIGTLQTSIDSSSTNDNPPTAKAVYDLLETFIDEVLGRGY